MTGYSKLFSSLVTSSVWQEDNATRVVWITMLATADANGVVEAAIPGLANVAKVSLSECKEAIRKLEAPDPYSRTEDNEGRRIEKCEGGWRLLNYAYYREKGRGMERRKYMRNYQRERRRRKHNVNNVNNVNKCKQCQPVSTAANRSQPIAEAEANKNFVYNKGIADGNRDPQLERLDKDLATLRLGRTSHVAQRRGRDAGGDDPGPAADSANLADCTGSGDADR